MSKFEYKVIGQGEVSREIESRSVNSRGKVETGERTDQRVGQKSLESQRYGTTEVLNDLGAEGWELAVTWENRLVFKREII